MPRYGSADFMYACCASARSGLPAPARAVRTAAASGGSSGRAGVVIIRSWCRSGEPEVRRFLPQLVADPRVGGVADDVPRLGALVVPPQLGHAVLGDDGALLEARDRLVEERDDGGDVGPGVPGPQ